MCLVLIETVTNNYLHGGIQMTVYVLEGIYGGIPYVRAVLPELITDRDEIRDFILVGDGLLGKVMKDK